MLHQNSQAESAIEEDATSTETASIVSAASDPSNDMDTTTGRSAMSSLFGRSSSGTGGGSRSSSPSRIAKSPFSFHRRSSSQGSADRQKKKKDKEDALARWLAGGNVIYKSVGLGLMDLTVGMQLVGFAREKGVGSHVDGF